MKVEEGVVDVHYWKERRREVLAYVSTYEGMHVWWRRRNACLVKKKKREEKRREEKREYIAYSLGPLLFIIIVYCICALIGPHWYEGNISERELFCLLYRIFNAFNLKDADFVNHPGPTFSLLLLFPNWTFFSIQIPLFFMDYKIPNSAHSSP